MKLLQACLRVKKELQGSFHHCGGPVMLVQACLLVGKTWESRFHRRGGVKKHVEACLSTKNDRETVLNAVVFLWSSWKPV